MLASARRAVAGATAYTTRTRYDNNFHEIDFESIK